MFYPTDEKDHRNTKQDEDHQPPFNPEISSPLIFQTIKDKNCTYFDFWSIFLKHRSHNDFSVLKVLTPVGHNVLHECIESAKLTYFQVLVQLGYWKILCLQKVPDDSTSEYKGKTAKYLAEVKRAKKPLEEFNLANDWENSLSPLMRAIRSGDLIRVNQMLRETTEETFYKDFNGGNALYWTVVTGNSELFSKLVDIGVDPTTRTKKNENLLHVACCIGRFNMIGVILEKCANLNPWLKDVGNKTPMDRYD